MNDYLVHIVYRNIFYCSSLIFIGALCVEYIFRLFIEVPWQHFILVTLSVKQYHLYSYHLNTVNFI